MTKQARRWLEIAIALVSIGFGVIALGRPYWILESVPMWLGLVALLILLWSGADLQRRVLMLVVLIVAVTLLVARSFAVELLVYGVLVYALFHGIHAFTKLKHQTWFAGIQGLALVLLGILGAYWIDVASILIGLLIGPALIVAGACILWNAWRGERSHKTIQPRHHCGTSWQRTATPPDVRLNLGHVHRNSGAA